MPAERQIGLDAGLEARHPNLVQPHHLEPKELAVGQIAVRDSPPQLEGLQTTFTRYGRILCLCRRLDEGFELTGIHLRRVDTEQVGMIGLLDQFGADHGTEAGDLRVKPMQGLTRIIFPHVEYEPVVQNRTSGVKEEVGQQGTGHGAPGTDLLPARADHHRAQDARIAGTSAMSRYPPRRQATSYERPLRETAR